MLDLSLFLSLHAHPHTVTRTSNSSRFAARFPFLCSLAAFFSSLSFFLLFSSFESLGSSNRTSAPPPNSFFSSSDNTTALSFFFAFSLPAFFFPSMAKQIETWHKAGGRVLLHSCGNVDAVAEDLADMGIDALNNIQVRSGMNLASIKQRIGDRVTLVGNVDATGIMCQPDKSLISAAIQEVIDTAGQDGALILATDHSFHEGIPTENVIYFLEEARRLGKF